MSSVIRKISIGSDYKTDAMHYSLGQLVYGGHTISHILSDKEDNSYNIYIKKQRGSIKNFQCYLLSIFPELGLQMQQEEYLLHFY